MMSKEPPTIVSDLETPPATAGFTENSQKVEKSLVFPQKSLVSGDLNLEYNVCSPPVPTTIVPDPETRPSTAGSTQKLENSPISTQKTPFPPLLKCFNWADDAAELPIPSTGPAKQPRDLSGLRSSSFPKNPFSSLQHRHQKFNKKRFYFPVITSRYRRYHLSSGSHLHFQNSHHHPCHPFFVSLDWDQDPRLLDLSNALKALGWVRQ
jgi:hypothetical protein